MWSIILFKSESDNSFRSLCDESDIVCNCVLERKSITEMIPKGDIIKDYLLSLFKRIGIKKGEEIIFIFYKNKKLHGDKIKTDVLIEQLSKNFNL